MMGSRRALLVALAFSALLAAGCGGGGDGDDAKTAAAAALKTTPGLSKAELIKQGDEKCAYVNRRVAVFLKSKFSPSEKADWAAGAHFIMVQYLEGIGVPEETDGYPEFMAAAKALLEAEGKVDVDFESDKANLVVSEKEATAVLASFREAASEYGLDECAKGVTLPVLTASQIVADERVLKELAEEHAQKASE